MKLKDGEIAVQISVDEVMWRYAKGFAADRRITLKQLVRDALSKHVGEPPAVWRLKFGAPSNNQKAGK